MKQNVIIILLTAVAVLLLVNLLQNRIPPTAQAASGSHSWQLACVEVLENNGACYAIGPKGHVSLLLKRTVSEIGTVK